MELRARRPLPLTAALTSLWLVSACSGTKLSCAAPRAGQSASAVARDGQVLVLDAFDWRQDEARRVPLPLAPCRIAWTSDDQATAQYTEDPVGTGGALLTVEASLPGEAGGLVAIADGALDASFDTLCRSLGRATRPVYVRFDPEMEVPVKLLPWQRQWPSRYVAAYRRFVEQCRAQAPRAKFVWAPAGYPGDDEYYPGNAWVDAVSVTLDGASELASDAFPRPASLEADLRAKLHRLRFIDRPVLVLGTPGTRSASYRPELLARLHATIESERDAVYSDANFADSERAEFDRGAAAPMLGAYDPGGTLTSHPALGVEHLFGGWKVARDGSLAREIDGVFARGHDLILTLEPWRDVDQERDPEVLQHVVEGRHDEVLHALYARLRATERTVYLRFAHEMEIPGDRYPWQSQDPLLYIHAYRHVALLEGPRPANLRLVWGPAGDRGSLTYWPGADVVDFISLAIYGLPDKNITDHARQEAFEVIMHRKLRRMRFVQAPVFITELGVKGPEDFQRAWLVAAAEAVRREHRVVGFSYFNQQDIPKAWGDIEAPNWSLTPGTFDALARALRGD